MTTSVDYKKPLLGKVAVVTGGGRGVGRAIALAMAAHGAKVVVNDLGVNVDGTGGSNEPAQQVVDEIKKMGGEAVANFDNVITPEGGERIIKTATDAFGRIDILVTCAGILRDRMLFNMTEQEWDAVIATHMKGTFNCVKPAAVLMRQQRGGRIITITSSSGLYGNIGQANYGSAKSGIAGFTKAIARDLGRYGVTCNSIAPHAGTRMTLTEEYKRGQEERQRKGITREGFAVDIDLEKMPPEDVAPFVVYIASDLAADVNGQVFWVGGGAVSWVAPPRPLRTIYKHGRWTLDELIEAVPTTLAVGLVNPAPPQPPREPVPAQKQ